MEQTSNDALRLRPQLDPGLKRILPPPNGAWVQRQHRGANAPGCYRYDEGSGGTSTAAHGSALIRATEGS